MSTCPACGDEGVPFKGMKDSPYLIIFGKPYVQEVTNGWRKPKPTGLDVLRQEFIKVGMELSDFRLVWLDLHVEGGNENCQAVAFDLVMDEAKHKKVIVLVGSDVTERFIEMSASDTAGLQVDCAMLSAPVVFVLPKPEGVFVKGAGVGELRLACQKLERIIIENGY